MRLKRQGNCRDAMGSSMVNQLCEQVLVAPVHAVKITDRHGRPFHPGGHIREIFDHAEGVVTHERPFLRKN